MAGELAAASNRIHDQRTEDLQLAVASRKRERVRLHRSLTTEDGWDGHAGNGREPYVSGQNASRQY